MTRADFDALVTRIEVRYAGRVAALERCISVWVVLGLVGIVSWLLVLVAVGAALAVRGAMIAAPLSLVLIVVGVCLLLYGLCQTAYILRVEPAPRQGRTLKPDEGAALRQTLAGLEKELQCPPFHEILITLDFNAAVHQVPRLGLLGWPRTYLEIGLPLAHAMSADELRAVLAHECAHRSARHGRSAGRLYLLNQTWSNLFHEMQQPAAGGFSRVSRWALNTFVSWYWPRVHARAFVLSRAHEYQADSLAAEVAGSAALAGALWRMECLAPWLFDRFWPDLHQQAQHSPEPPADIARVVADACRTGPPATDIAACLERALSRATSPDETHPAFVERVRPLGWTSASVRQLGFPQAASVSAAQVILGADLPAIERALSTQWHARSFASWRDRHRLALAQLRTRPPSEAAPASADAATSLHLLWDAAQDTAQRLGLTSAVPLLRQILERDAHHAGAAVLLGRHLVRLGDPESEPLLSGVLGRGDEVWLPRACEALEEHYRRTGKMEALRQTRARLDRHEADCRAAQRERMTITARDHYSAHGLGDELLAELRTLLAAQPEIGTAWLARKELTYFPQRRLFVLSVADPSAGWWGGWDAEQAALRRLTAKVKLPGQVLVVGRHGAFRSLAKKIASLPGAEIYRREV